MVTEFGDTGAACSPAFAADVIAYADAHGAGWTAWAWFPGGCNFPSLIEDWTGSSSPVGKVVRDRLLGYDDPPTIQTVPGVSYGPDVSYQFDKSAEGWRLGDYPDAALTNLGATVLDGGKRPSLGFAVSDDDPSSGELKLTAAFTGFEQYADAVIDIHPGFNLSGKTLHARVKATGALTSVRIQLLARAGSGAAEAAGPSVDASLSPGTWSPLALELGGIANVSFDSTDVTELAIRLSTGPASDGDFQRAGDTVLEIDAVTN